MENICILKIVGWKKYDFHVKYRPLHHYTLYIRFFMPVLFVGTHKILYSGPVTANAGTIENSNGGEQ